MRLASLIAIAVVACPASPEPRSPVIEALPERAPSVPADREAFLRELLSLDHENVRVRYDVGGKAGIEGELDVIVAAGGFRREHWSLTVELEPSRPELVRGTTIRTPAWQWTNAVPDAPVLTQQPLTALADAYTSLPEEARARVIARMREWQREVVRSRADHPGERDTVLGRTCLVTHVNHHRICVWEETGLVLSYRSDAFTVEARTIDVDVPPERAWFELPPGAATPPEDLETEDPHRVLERFAAGDFAVMARVRTPGPRFAFGD